MKRILNVGQCAADHTRISQVLDSQYKVEIETADDQNSAIEKISQGNFDLVLINRVLDRTGTEGVEILRELEKMDAAGDTPPVMLVSNFEDAQESAVQAGATRGFGKAALADPATFQLLDPFLKD